jgi:hypothetical protein
MVFVIQKTRSAIYEARRQREGACQGHGFVDRRRTRIAAAAAVLALASGCGGNGHHHDEATVASTPVPLDSVTSPGAVAAHDINLIIGGLRQHGLDQQIVKIIVFDKRTDPAHEIGARGGYLARASFADTTISSASTTPAAPTGSLARGGTVEMFQTSSAAAAGLDAESDRVPGEHDLLSANILLRLSPRFPAPTVTKYRTALHETTGKPVQQS